uniref:Uncharacterized protein n=1 Tax=Acrobeloides nanus TaxID=290746 RepID=A0A914DH87_9BILA
MCLPAGPSTVIRPTQDKRNFNADLTSLNHRSIHQPIIIRESVRAVSPLEQPQYLDQTSMTLKNNPPAASPPLVNDTDAGFWLVAGAGLGPLSKSTRRYLSFAHLGFRLPAKGHEFHHIVNEHNIIDLDERLYLK